MGRCGGPWTFLEWCGRGGYTWDLASSGLYVDKGCMGTESAEDTAIESESAVRKVHAVKRESADNRRRPCKLAWWAVALRLLEKWAKS